MNVYLDKVKGFIREALECTVFVSPRAPGLTFDEIREIGARLNYKPGEITDALAGMSLHSVSRGSQRLAPDQQTTINWKFYLSEQPEYRNFKAFDFVFTELSNLARELGAANAQIDRSTLVQRAIGQNIPENDIEAAITILLLAEILAEPNGMLRFQHAVHGGPLPSVQVQQNAQRIRRDSRTPILPVVRDLISRRTDGRPQHAEPFDAFSEQLERLGYKDFRLWWAQIVSELRRSDVQSSSVSICVLSAALVEGALTFVVKHAQAQQLGPFRSTAFDREPRYWRIEDLVASAASGGDSGILDMASRGRADALIRSRQRIHAGRMLSSHPAGVPDLRPDEAREANATAEMVVRQVLDWLERFPPA